MSPLTLRRNKNEDVVVEEHVPAEMPDVPDERPFPGYVRVNLLPQRFLEQLRLRTIKRWLLAGLVFVLLLLGLLFYLAQRDLSEAETQLNAAEMRRTQLLGEVAQYAEVPRVFATASLAQESISTAMSREVRWAFLLNQLSFATPAGVTLNTVGGAISEEGPVQTSPGDVLPPAESVGTMTFAGTGSSFSEVAAWLDSLQTLQDYTYPFLTNSAKAAPTTDKASNATVAPVTGGGDISWESAADLSANALSGRYGTPPPATGTSGSTTPAPTATPPAPDGAAQ